MAVNDFVEREERPAYVQFETRPMEDKEATLREGRVMMKDVDFVKVTPPYSKDCFEQKADTWFENVKINVKNGRTPQDWLDIWLKTYEHFKLGKEEPINGISIKNWSSITPSQVKNLLSIGIKTVEDIAQANDEGLKRMGMGARELQNRAKAFLQATKDHGPITIENAALKEENIQLKGTIESLQSKIESLTQQISNVASQNLQIRPEGISVEDILDSTEEKSEYELLKKEYKATFGKEPHHLMRENGMKKALGIK